MHNELANLKESLIKMSSFVDYSLESLFFSCEHSNLDGLSKTITSNKSEVDLLYKRIELQSFYLLENYSLTGTTLRFVLSTVKISHDLHRMSGQLVNILISVSKVPSIELAIIKEMMKEITLMLRITTDGYVLCRIDLAQDAIKVDKVVNEHNKKIIKSFMKRSGDGIDFKEGYHSTRMAKALERIGDYIKNMAKEVIKIYKYNEDPIEQISKKWESSKHEAQTNLNS